MNWKHKALIQKILGHMPWGDFLHYQLQRKAGGLKDVSSECRSKIEDWRIMMGHLCSVGVVPEESRFMEIGTGWYPTFPFCLYLLGAKSIQTFDLNPHLKKDLTQQCINEIGRNLNYIKEFSSNPELVESRYQQLSKAIGGSLNLSELTNGVIKYSAPADATKTDLDAGGVDVVFSNSVLEHVPGDIIDEMMKEAYRVLSIDGVMFHSVNCGDHYAYVDSSINQLNYLQFSSAEWKRYTNAFLYQNRIRAKEFVLMAKSHGFNIEIDTSNPLEERLQQLKALNVSADFREYTDLELCLTTIDFLGRKLG